MLKKTLIFIGCLLPWFFNSLFLVDYTFYNKLVLPFFAPPSIFYKVSWTIIYITLAISISKIVINIKINNNYKMALIINYIFNQGATLLLFGVRNLFLGFAFSVGTFISSLFLYQESNLLNKFSAIILIPYIILAFFITIISISVYFYNI